LSGLIAALFFLLLRQIIAKNIFPTLTKTLGGEILRLIIKCFFILALVAMLLGFVGYVVPLILPPAGTVETDISLYENIVTLPGTQSPYDSDKVPSETTVRYYYDRHDDVLEIDYELPYLSLLMKGGPIRPLPSLGFSWWFPKLSIKVVNNTDRTLFLTETAIEVLSSEVNSEPLIVIHNGDHMDAGETYLQLLGGFYITNEGWGDVRDAVVDYQLVTNKSGGRPDLNGSIGMVRLGTFSERAIVQLLASPSNPYEECRKGGSTSIDVMGSLSYETERYEKRRTAFQVVMPLVVCGGPAGPSIASSQYNVVLESDKSGYVKRVPIAQELKPGATDHFLIQLGSDKSAKFDLNISLLAAGRVTMQRKRVSIEIFARRPAMYFATQTKPKVSL